MMCKLMESLCCPKLPFKNFKTCPSTHFWANCGSLVFQRKAHQYAREKVNQEFVLFLMRRGPRAFQIFIEGKQ